MSRDVHFTPNSFYFFAVNLCVGRGQIIQFFRMKRF
jgi:hypothetical protein